MRTTRAGFTLVELMIVVAIIGILAAIAVPQFIRMQWRAKRAEVPSNIDGIKTAQVAYNAAFDRYIEQTSYYPSSAVGKGQVPWPTGSAFDTLGWTPDGEVRGAYRVVSTSSTDFLVTGICDVDGDGTASTYTSRKSVNATMTTHELVY
jgi:type IV pilus assembly protein PilA